MVEIPEQMLFEGVSVDIAFDDPRPQFGDLFQICGRTHPRFPPTDSRGFENLSELQFDQADDYFGVASLIDDGDDVVVWLYPLIDGEPVDHHPGPFDGVRLEYNVLRNPARHADHYLRCVREFAGLGVGATYRSRGVELGVPPKLSALQVDIHAIIEYWSSQGIAVGSDEALEMDF